HDAEKVENRLLYADVGDDEDSKGEESFVDNRVSVEEALTAADLARDFVQSLPDAYRPYVELLISGECASAAECAERLNIPIAKIRVMDKAIRRRRRTWKGTPPH